MLVWGKADYNGNAMQVHKQMTQSQEKFKLNINKAIKKSVKSNPHKRDIIDQHIHIRERIHPSKSVVTKTSNKKNFTSRIRIIYTAKEGQGNIYLNYLTKFLKTVNNF